MKKQLYILFAVLLLTKQFTFSQIPSSEERTKQHFEQLKKILKEAFVKAPYIFEGKIIHGEDYYDQARTGIYTKYSIKVTKALKGNITDSIVELIRIEPDVNVPLNGQLQELRKNVPWDFTGVFFGFQTKYPLGPDFNKSKLYLSPFWSMFIKYSKNPIIEPVANYEALEFKKFSDVYEAIGFHDLSLEQQKREKDNKAGTITKKEYDEYLKRKEQLKKKVNGNSLNQKIASADVTFTFQNGIVTGTSPKFYEFDVYASTSSSGTFLDGAQVDIQYNSAAFGTSVVTNSLTSLIVVTRGASFPAANYPYFNQFDNTPNVLRIVLDNLGTPNRVLLPTIPTALFHVKIKVTCGQNVNLLFPITGSTGGAYATSATTPVFNPFSPVIATSTDNTNACSLNISNFNPTIINAGRGEILTINGANFGNTQGTGFVSLKSAEDGGISDIQLDADDYVSWSDNQIKIVVPSYSRVSPVGSSVGSGSITVSNGTNTFVTTNTLTVYYSEKNYLETAPPFPAGFSSRKQKIYITGEPSTYTLSTKIPIKIDYTAAAAFPGTPNAKGCIEKAIRDWICETKIPFVIVGDTTYTSNMPSNNSFTANVVDGISTIHFTDFTLDASIAPSTIAQTFLRAQRCDTLGGARTIGTLPEFDIEFDLNRAWFCDTIITSQNKPANKYDFYEVILHELGHVNLLKHNNDFLSIMYYNSEFTNSVFWGNRRVNITIEDYQGGGTVILESKNTKYSGLCSFLAITPDNKCGNIGIHENTINSNDITVLPNPFADNLLISIKLNGISNIKLSVYDVYGKRIQVLDDVKNKTDGYKFEYNGNELSSGIYFMQIIINGEQVIKKVVKQ